MASSDSERKRKQTEAAAGSEEAAAAAAAEEEDDDDEGEERWVGPLPGEAAQAKKRRGNGRSGASARRFAGERPRAAAVGSPPGGRPRRQSPALALGRLGRFSRAPARCLVSKTTGLWRAPPGCRIRGRGAVFLLPL